MPGSQVWLGVAVFALVGSIVTAYTLGGIVHDTRSCHESVEVLDGRFRTQNHCEPRQTMQTEQSGSVLIVRCRCPESAKP